MRLAFVFVCSLLVSNQLVVKSLETDDSRYLLYDCNPGEGFNLRRDVYIRIANLVKHLNTKETWTLVLPPWGGIGYHWKEHVFEQSKIPWSKFFDIESLAKHISVIEYEAYVERMGGAVVDELWYLQPYDEEIDFDNWVDKVDERPCIDPPVYESDNEGKIRGWFWGYEETYAKKFKCISIQGSARIISDSLHRNTSAKSIMLDRGENLIHDVYGGKDYWDARRSMVFSKKLREIAAEVRRLHLNSTDEKDHCVLPLDWTKNERQENSAVGGPYIAAHVRRKDFMRAREGHVATLKKVAQDLITISEEYDITTIFIASDGTEKEMKELRNYLSGMNMVRYTPNMDEDRKLKKGGVAIIDQIICSHARYFIGSYESTFSFRIAEEREIMGFSSASTYNRFCADEETDCEQPNRWKIVWKSDDEIWY